MKKLLRHLTESTLTERNVEMFNQLPAVLNAHTGVLKSTFREKVDQRIRSTVTTMEHKIKVRLDNIDIQVLDKTTSNDLSRLEGHLTSLEANPNAPEVLRLPFGVLHFSRKGLLPQTRHQIGQKPELSESKELYMRL